MTVFGSRNKARAVMDLLKSDGGIVTWQGEGQGAPIMVGLPETSPKTISGELPQTGELQVVSD